MAATSGGHWICLECGKVCKSRGGLTQHSSVHKRHPRVDHIRNTSYRIYHAYLDGMFGSLFYLFDPDPLQENRAVRMESSFPPERHQLLHLRSPTPIGHRSFPALGSNLPRFSTQRPPSQTTLSTNSSTSGALHSSLTATQHQYSTMTTFTQQLMRSNLETCPGNHIPPITRVSARTTRPHRSG